MSPLQLFVKLALVVAMWRERYDEPVDDDDGDGDGTDDHTI